MWDLEHCWRNCKIGQLDSVFMFEKKWINLCEKSNGITYMLHISYQHDIS